MLRRLKRLPAQASRPLHAWSYHGCTPVCTDEKAQSSAEGATSLQESRVTVSNLDSKLWQQAVTLHTRVLPDLTIYYT